MIYLLGIDHKGTAIARLCSVFDRRLVDATYVIHQWSGRNSRGTAQFVGHALKQILNDENETLIEEEKARDFITDLINR